MNKTFRCLLCCAVVALSSCKVHDYYYKADFIGFSSDVEKSYQAKDGAFKNLSEQSAPTQMKKGSPNALNKYIDAVSVGNNTTLYLAADLACDRLRYVRKKDAKRDPETEYFLFILSDGLDNASVKASKNHREATFVTKPDQYEKRLARKLKNAMGLIKDYNNLTVYPMVVMGGDLNQVRIDNKKNPEEFKEYMRKQFECLKYATEEPAPEVIVAENYKEVYKEIENAFRRPKSEFRVAKDFVDKPIRMTFTNSAGENIQLTGTLKRTSLTRYALKDVQLTGATKDDHNTRYSKNSGKTLVAKKAAYADENVWFVLKDLKSNKTGKYFTPIKAKTRQDYLNDGLWQRNVEFDGNSANNPNTYCIFLLDASSSVLGKLPEAKKCVKEILKLIDSTL